MITAQPLPSIGSNPVGMFELSNIESIAALKAINTGTTDPTLSVILPQLGHGTFANVLGYASKNDGGGGIFVFDAYSTTADDGGMTIAPTLGRGRWIRQADKKEYNVLWFGAVNGAAADDSTKIQAAIDYVYALGGGVVRFPCGVYKGNVILKTGVFLLGADNALNGSPTNNTVKFIAAATGAVIDTPAGAQYNCGVAGMTIYGLGAGTAAIGIKLRNVTRGIFRYLTFDNFADQGLLCLAGVANQFYWCIAQNCLLNRTRAGDDGVFNVSGTDHLFTDCELTASVTTNKTAGGQCHGWYIGGSNHFLVNCIGEISDSGFCIASGYSRFTNCRADLNMMHGFYILGEGYFNNCLALSNSQDTTNTYSGFYVAANTAQGNHFVNCRANRLSGGSHKYGFEDYAIYDALGSRSSYVSCHSDNHVTAAYLTSTTLFEGSSITLANANTRTAATGSITVAVEQFTGVIFNQVSAATVTNFTGGVQNQSLYLYGNANVTIQNNATIKTSTGADKVLAANKIYHYKLFGTVWIEVTT